MDGHTNIIVFGDRRFTIAGAGPEIEAGSKAPGFVLTDNNLQPFSSEQLKGKNVLISCVPSLDTEVCSLQTRRFNKEAENLDGNITVLTVSTDLPFAQRRWVKSEGINKIITLSDHLKADFGARYGVLIEELRLLARAVFVIDKNGIVVYRQVVKDASQEPDYNAAMEAVKNLLN